MYITPMTERRDSLQGQTAFGGLDCRPSAPPGWFSNDENVCSDEYPLLSTRPARGVFARSSTGDVSGGICMEDKLCVIDNSGTRYNPEIGDYESCPALWIGDEKLDMEMSDGEKLLVPFSYYLLIWPDKLYVNVLDPSDRGSMTERASLFEGSLRMRIEVVSAGGETPSRSSTEEPSDEEAGITVQADFLWHRLRHTVLENGYEKEVPAALFRQINKQPDVEGYLWQEVESFLRFSRTQDQYGTGGYHGCLTPGEYIRLSDFAADAVAIGTVAPSDDDLRAVNAPHTVVSVTTNTYGGREETTAFTVRGLLRDAGAYVLYYNGIPKSRITVERAVPELDCAVAYEGRLYGAFRGVSPLSGEEVNELYISAAGDFKRFYKVEDTTADPLVMSVVEPGAFRGAAVVGNVVTFFKDRKLLTVGGSTPDSFYISAYDGRGPSAGCERSLCVLGGNAYYLSGHDVVAYYGGNATVVSEKLSLSLLGVATAVGGGFGHKYYLYTVLRNGRRALLVLDTARGLWHRERPPAGGIAGFAATVDGLYMIEPGEGSRVWTVGDHVRLGGQVPASERLVPWMWESGLIGLDTPQKKYITKAEIRLTLAEGATAELWVQYDSEPHMRTVWRADAGKTRTVSSRMMPHRCDHLRLRLRGTGQVTLLGVFITTENEGGR